LVIHSEDDQVVPYADSAPLAVKLLKRGVLKTYRGLPHGCMTTHPDLINADILGFIRGEAVAAPESKAAEPALT
jgi:non-heme chloroperoxidase